MQVKAESTTRMRYQRSSTGTVAFGECDANGKFITIENQHAYKVQEVKCGYCQDTLHSGRVTCRLVHSSYSGQWPISGVCLSWRSYSPRRPYSDCVLFRSSARKRQMKRRHSILSILFSSTGKVHSPPNVYIAANIRSWGSSGQNATTTLLNDKHEERAQHTQNTERYER